MIQELQSFIAATGCENQYGMQFMLFAAGKIFLGFDFFRRQIGNDQAIRTGFFE